jgi:hypothetical protein
METERVQSAIANAISEHGPNLFEDWATLETIAERVEVEGTQIGPIANGRTKWSVRGMVQITLYNLDEEKFGSLKYYLMASGHHVLDDILIDSLIISSDEH